MMGALALEMQTLRFAPVLECPELVAVPVFDCVRQWRGTTSANAFKVAAINPDWASGADFAAHYGVPISEGANCLIIEIKRNGERFMASCVVPAGNRTDLSGLVRQRFEARQVSMAAKDAALAMTQMEFGSITPFGLPPAVPILVDARLAALPRVIVGGGLRHSKLAVPGSAFRELAGAEIIEGLGLANIE